MKNVQLSAQNSVIIRMWLPKYKGKQVSYVTATLLDFFDPKNASTGHISIAIRRGTDETYISHWPFAKPNIYPVPGCNSTLENDLSKTIGEGDFADTYIILYSLDTEKMIRKFNEIGEHAPWFLLGNKFSRKPAYSCSSYVYEILCAGGLFDGLLASNEKLTNVISPIQLTELLQTAKKRELSFYPETGFFIQKNLESFKSKLIELIKKVIMSNDDQTDLSDFLKKHIDYHDLFSTFIPNQFHQLCDEIYKIVDEANTQKLLSCLSTEQANNENLAHYVEYLLAQGANPFVKNDKGYNPLHCAIAKGDIRCAEILLNKYPKLIDSTIDDHDKQSEYKPNLFSLSRKNNLTYPTITPLELAIKTKNVEIINLLGKYNNQQPITTLGYWRSNVIA